jgi:hypothetical protein
MYSFFLNDTPIEQPVGFDAVQFQFARSEQYGGFIYRDVAFVEGVKALEIEEERPRRELIRLFEEKNILAEAVLVVKDDEREVYRGYVDFQDFHYDEKTAYLAMVDSPKTQQWAARAGQVQSLAPTRTVKLHSYRLIGKATHRVEAGRNVATGGAGTHFPPLVPQTNDRIEGAVLGMNGALLTNEGSEIVAFRMAGVLVVTTVSPVTQTGALKLIVTSGDGDETVTQVGTVTLGAVPTSQRVVVDKTLMLHPGDVVTLRFDNANTSAPYTYTYDAAQTSLSIEVETPRPFTDCPGLLVPEALEALAPGTMQLLEAGRLLVCNGRHLRGLGGPVRVSFDQLFDFLRKRFAAKADLVQGTVFVGRQYAGKATPPMALGTPDRLTWSAALDWLPGTINVGYRNWQAEAAYGEAEVNANQTWSTGLPTRTEWDLTTDVITASSLIEEGRRRSTGPDAAKDWKWDEAVFVIELDGSRMRSKAGTDGEGNYYVASADTLFNWSLRPETFIRAWEEWMVVKTLMRTAYAGLASPYDHMMLFRDRLTGRQATIVKSMELDGWMDLQYGEEITTEWLGETCRFVIKEATLKMNPFRQSEVEIIGWEVKP